MSPPRTCVVASVAYLVVAAVLLARSPRRFPAVVTLFGESRLLEEVERYIAHDVNIRPELQHVILAEGSARCSAQDRGSDAVNCSEIHRLLGLARRELRIFVYDLPLEYNWDFYANLSRYRSRGWKGMSPGCRTMDLLGTMWNDPFYALEMRVHEALLRSPFRTLDPENATMFYVPMYSAQYRWCLGWEDGAQADFKDFVRRLWSYLIRRYPRYVRPASPVRNHLVAATFDHGILGGGDWPEDIPTTQIIFFGSSQSNHIRTPPCCPGLRRHSSDFTRPAWRGGRKDFDLYFKGSREQGFRAVFYDRYNELQASGPLRWPEAGRKAFGRAATCFVPRGYAEWTGRDVEAIFAGCIPVSFGRKEWFFARFIDWQAFTLDVPGETADSVDESLMQIQALVADPKRMQERMHYVWPLLTIASSPTRAAAEGILLDMMGLFYAELASWVSHE